MTTERRCLQTNYSFFVRVWAESREIVGAPAIWRGSIEEVITGERYYFVNLNQIEAYIHSFIKPESPEPSSQEP